eukprot:TRINITY_DN7445_c0_g2_i1.p1 TRINITY_DN7445_c0_g2~~TRINITY_DN7445_c0_g2_i1.p1  ORF type:complete len:236 (+),score=26.21 TRINITY_DN7445_c0_g2_i1:52-759(+)
MQHTLKCHLDVLPQGWAEQGLTPLYETDFYPTTDWKKVVADERANRAVRGGGGYVQRTPPKGKRVGKSSPGTPANQPEIPNQHIVQKQERIHREGLKTPQAPSVPPLQGHLLDYSENTTQGSGDSSPITPSIAHPGVYLLNSPISECLGISPPPSTPTSENLFPAQPPVADLESVEELYTNTQERTAAGTETEVEVAHPAPPPFDESVPSPPPAEPPKPVMKSRKAVKRGSFMIL